VIQLAGAFSVDSVRRIAEILTEAGVAFCCLRLTPRLCEISRHREVPFDESSDYAVRIDTKHRYEILAL
jgi:hypothetical protein